MTTPPVFPLLLPDLRPFIDRSLGRLRQAETFPGRQTYRDGAASRRAFDASLDRFRFAVLELQHPPVGPTIAPSDHNMPRRTGKLTELAAGYGAPQRYRK